MVTWAAYAQSIDAGTARDLAALAEARPGIASEAYRAGITVREAINRIFADRCRGTTPAAGDLAVVQRGFTSAMAAARLETMGDGFGWALPGDDLNRAWWPFVIATMELLTMGPADRVKVCASSRGCDGLFLDTSKNGSRRWCRMADCGTEAKIHRQSDRRRAARS